MTLKLSPKSQKVQEMFDTISHRYDFLNRLLSFRQDVRWRKKLLQNITPIEHNEGVFCDVACGTGDVVFAVEKEKPNYNTFYGIDISAGMLKHAKLRNPFSKCQFLQTSAEQLPIKDKSVDCLSIAFGLRNVDNRYHALTEFKRVLKPRGRLLVLEFFPANHSVASKFFGFYFKKILPFIGGLFADKAAYEYLPQSVQTMPSGPEFARCLEATGFIPTQEVSWLFGAVRLFVAVCPDDKPPSE